MPTTKFSSLFWNILDGFHNPRTDSFEQYRFDLAKRLINEIDADIIVLNEASYGSVADRDGKIVPYNNLLELYNFNYSKSHTRWGNLIASKFQITPIETKTIVDRCGAASEILIDNNVFLFETYHLHPFWDKKTKYDVLDQIVKNRNTYDNYILGGDFNAVHYIDIDPWDINNPSNVLKSIENAGMHDAYRYNRTFTFPTNMVPVTPNDPRVKLDHVFFRGIVVPVASNVLRGIKYIDEISDHYPLLVEWEIDI